MTDEQSVPIASTNAEAEQPAVIAAEAPEGANSEATATATTSEAPAEKVISVQNPTPEEMTELMSHIKVNYDFEVNVKPVSFNFKRSKDPETGIITVRNSVNLAIPYPSMEGIVNIMEKGEKGLELLVEAIEGVVNSVARDMLEDTELNAATFPVEKLSWEAIAAMPKAQRRGGGIAKETWESFAKDYIEVMQQATDKKPEQIANAARILHGRLASVKTNKPVLQLLVEQIAIYTDVTENLEDFQECVTFLVAKAETFLNISEADLLANL